MASKKQKAITGRQTVEIDREAYVRLDSARVADESFSEVIKRCIRPRQTAEEVLRAMRRAQISASTLKSIEESASRRRQLAHLSKG